MDRKKKRRKNHLIVIVGLISLVILIGIASPFIYMYGETFGYPWNYIGWQTVEIADLCVLKIPGKWIVTFSDNTIYITDKSMSAEDVTIYFVGTFRVSEQDPIVDPITLLDGVVRIEMIESEGLSNSVGITLNKFYYKGEYIERYQFGTYSAIDVQFVGWDASIDYTLIRKIAITLEES